MKFNPTKLSWAAPTTNADGTPITYALEYEVGLEDPDGELQPLMVVPSQLQTDAGNYEAPISDLGLPKGKTYRIAMRTFAKDDPKRMSQWSNTVEFAISEQIPNAPLELRVI